MAAKALGCGENPVFNKTSPKDRNDSSYRFTLSQIEYAIDRLTWLYRNRELVGGLEWEKEPKVLRFFVGRLKAIGDWPERLMAKFRADFGDSL